MTSIPVFTLDVTQDPLSPVVHGHVDIIPRIPGFGGSGWVRWLYTSDVNAPDSSLTFEHGQLVMRVVGGNGTQSNRREAWQLPDAPARYWNIRSRWTSHPPADGIVEHGHMHNMQVGSDGKIRSVIVWDFTFGGMLAGVWESNPDGSSFIVAQAPLKDSDAVTASSRTSNVVTVTVAAGATTRWAVGDPITVDLTDATFDGAFIITGVTNTTVSWPQTAADDADGGTGTITLVGAGMQSTISRTAAFTDAVRTNGVVTSTGLSLGHNFMVGDRITVDAADNTYDGKFVINGYNPFTAQVSWIQQGVANDASSGAGTIQKSTPYWVESRLLPGNILQARISPDIGVSLGGGSGGPMPAGIPPWESAWSFTWDISRVTGVTIPTEAGVPGLVAAHHSSSSPVRYDSVEANALSV